MTGGLEIVDIGQRLRRLDRGSRSWRARWIVTANRAIGQQIEAWKPDLLHVHGDAWDLLSVPWRASRRVPTLLTVHGGLSRTYRYRLLTQATFWRVDGLIAVSAEILRQVAGLGPVPRRTLVLSSGVDGGFFSAATVEQRRAARLRRGLDHGAVIMATVARLVPVKGLDDFARAVVAVRERIGSAVRGLIIGEGPERGRLEAVIRATGAPVSLLGDVPPEEVRDVLWSTDVFVLTSVDLPGQREGTPTALIEAMSAGVPVVATAVGGVPDLLQGGRAGVLVAPAHPERVAEQVESLMRCPAMAREYRERGRLVAAGRSWADVAERATSFSEELCAAQAQRGAS